MALEKEVAVFEAHRAEWLTTHRNQYVLIKEERVVGFFDSDDEALVAGVDNFGLDSFLMRKVQESEPEIKIPALTLGVLNVRISP